MEFSLESNLGTVLACILSFLAAAFSSAGGVGGGSLYVPVLNIVAGHSLKTATAFSTFMVTGGTLSNVLYTLIVLRGHEKGGHQPLIDYDIAVVSQPCLLLGRRRDLQRHVSRVAHHRALRVFLASATFKTYGTGMKRWRAETAAARRMLEGGSSLDDGAGEALLGQNEGDGHRRQCVELMVLFTIWLCFFVIHLFIGGEGAKGVFDIEPCGVTYWLINVAQIPIAVASTACIMHQKRKSHAQKSQEFDQAVSVKSKLESLPVYVFPVAALLTGVMSGLFGIGGGLLLNPVLLQIGVPPKTASSTTMFMVLFCASMSMVQFIILGVDGIVTALVYAITCFVASIVGLVVIQGAIRKSGRVSLIVFMVAAILVLSVVVIACSGAVRVWVQYTSGQYMGFKRPC
uniref:Sulfite exporter TauE/SafE family protein n=1 Tax=Oryza punctata TaxID=4537 RepID=A0A0E0JPN3_ORYPU